MLSGPGGNELQDEWREYDFGDRVYRIERPVRLWIGTTTHRILDHKGVVHCVPAPGYLGCVLRWAPLPGTKHVKF